jgi:uncharacterized membrane protein YuzA (DUF378 family)
MYNYIFMRNTNLSDKKGGFLMKWFDNTALTLVIVGAINWLLVGVFRFDLVALLFGNLSWISRIVYTLVAISGLWLTSLFFRSRENTPALES